METLTPVLSFIKTIWHFIARPDVGAVASVIGTIVSIWVGYTVRDIRRRVLFRNRAPQVVTNLHSKASVINDLLQDFDANKEQIIVEIALSLELMRNVVDKLSGGSKSTIKSTIKNIQVFRKTPSEKIKRGAVREIYTQILVSAQAIENLIADTIQEP